MTIKLQGVTGRYDFGRFAAYGASMTIEQLRRAKNERPFRPFDIRMADGQSIRVGHPEVLLVPPKAERTFVVARDDETYQIIDLLLVATLDFGSTRARRNGRPRENDR